MPGLKQWAGDPGRSMKFPFIIGLNKISIVIILRMIAKYPDYKIGFILKGL